MISAAKSFKYDEARVERRTGDRIAEDGRVENVVVVSWRCRGVRVEKLYCSA